jgi:hypothetical protein
MTDAVGRGGRVIYVLCSETWRVTREGERGDWDVGCGLCLILDVGGKLSGPYRYETTTHY